MTRRNLCLRAGEVADQFGARRAAFALGLPACPWDAVGTANIAVTAMVGDSEYANLISI